MISLCIKTWRVIMKGTFFAFILVIAGFYSCATLEPATEEQRTSQFVIEAKGKKAELYKKSLEWIATSFGSGKEVLEYKDEDSGKIIGNILTPFDIGLSTVHASHTMTIEIKDNKVRMTFVSHEVIFDKPTATFKDGKRNIYGESEMKDIRDSVSKAADRYKKFINKDSKSDW